jgi:hypothetical protein
MDITLPAKPGYICPFDEIAGIVYSNKRLVDGLPS